MAESVKKQGVKLTQLISDLHSGQESKISLALKSLHAHGKVEVLDSLASLLLTDLSAKNKSDVLEFLSCLNDSKAIDKMIEIIKDEKYLVVRQEILTTIWNSKLDYSYFLAEFVEIAVEGNFMEALDCLTIIENMEGPFEERHILEAQLHLKDYLEDTNPKDAQKAKIMSEIALILKDYTLQEDADIDFFND